MKAKKWIVVKMQFEGIHNWPECNLAGVGFLKNPHRHIFRVTAWIETTGDRALEFFVMQGALKRTLEFFDYTEDRGKNWIELKNLGSRSCEKIAEEIYNKLVATTDSNPTVSIKDRDVKIEVSEDGENGALLEWIKNEQEQN